MNLNLLRKEHRKKVPKKRKRERKKMSGEYLQLSESSPPSLEEDLSHIRTPLTETYFLHSDLVRSPHWTSSALNTL